ncbi:hypothetical protein D2917_21485 [Cupriavidus oxalaticus]|uniref:Thioesterase domain-containing protein n=2 Tax=Cupriavidus oxalaticus TaxID=96344 RepID=A0A5P3VLG1_9BURK|nr:hypothetical protein D2917_21485 [Cupriavidus oxalaticus]
MLSDRLAGELRSLPFKRLIFWSHCVGAALCLDTLQKISDDVRVERVFIGAKILHGAQHDEQLAGRMECRSDGEIISLLDKLAGIEEFTSVAEDSRGAIAAAFRHDAAGANRFLSRMQETAPTRRDVLMVNVVAKDDPLTENHAEHHERWRIFSSSLAMEVLESGGHFFCRTRPAQVASVILRHCGVQHDAS